MLAVHLFLVNWRQNRPSLPPPQLINRTCKTCEWNFDGKCACVNSDVGYGNKIDELEHDCWEIGLEYFIELVNKLPERKSKEYLYNPYSKFNDLFKLIHEE
jgi:hypothetical protein